MLYSTDMVVSILEDRKTKTRRMKGLELMNEDPDRWEFEEVGTLEWETYDGKPDKTMKSLFGASFLNLEYGSRNFQKCPYGQPGDILYVREKFRYIQPYGPESLHYDFAGSFRHLGPSVDLDKAYLINDYDRWRPSIHMPKVASRIWLQITDIKVERLQQITEEDALAEGIIECEDGTYYNYFTQKGLRYQDGVECLLAKGSFQSLWCSINGLDSWRQNPWVWVISFKVLSKTGKPEQIPSGFQTQPCTKGSLKSSLSGTVQKQVEEAHLLPGNGEGPHGFCVNPNSTCTMNYCDDNGCVERKRSSTGKEVANG